MANQAIDLYYDFCKDFLAIPCIKGKKSPTERFAGADETYTIESMMQNGWALQSGTSHFLGQNFARAFEVEYQSKTKTRELVWATSWGVSTRLIGALVMTHSDDKGLVLPPNVAPLQVVIVPILKGNDDEKRKLLDKAESLKAILQMKGIRVKVDDRDHIRPGQKFFEVKVFLILCLQIKLFTVGKERCSNKD
jgi:prolyl-tRNA synthetase